jgi:hypothetical protein
LQLSGSVYVRYILLPLTPSSELIDAEAASNVMSWFPSLVFRERKIIPLSCSEQNLLRPRRGDVVVVELRFMYCLGDSRAVSYDLLELNMLPTQWRLVAKISGGAAPENFIFFINWEMATVIKLKDYILYKYKERIKEKMTHYIICYR